MLAWARRQQASGHAVWSTPAILTWEAWLARAWQAAAQRGTVPALQLLTAGQERAVWESVLRELAADHDDPVTLGLHAAGLMRAATRATQWLLKISASAFSEEESLLAAALVRVRERCQTRGWLSLRLALPGQLAAALVNSAPPAFVGAQRATALQLALQAQCWPDVSLLLPEPARPAAAARLLRASHLEDELAACAQWSLERLRADPSTRLLVLSTCTEPSIAVQGAMLWRQLADGRLGDDAWHARMLAVEGGQPLAHQALVNDALAALSLAAEHIDTARLCELLRSPYLHVASLAGRDQLRRWLESRGIARWSTPTLLAALAATAALGNAAAALGEWIALLRSHLLTGSPRSAASWAGEFSACLASGSFALESNADSRELQRLARWTELLDELAGLDAVLPAMRCDEALQWLNRLAAQARHQEASGDAAITLAAAQSDPVVDYDGIWVLGLAANRWPAAPRPDPYVPPGEQRRCGWPESGVTARREEAQWLLTRWRQRTPELVLSYPAREGEILHRPALLLSQDETSWECAPEQGADLPQQLVLRDEDLALPPMAGGEPAGLLRGGVERLRVQRECAFRAQAHWRLGAEPPPTLSEGITPALRGRLLHALLQGVWTELGDHASLQASSTEALQALAGRQWIEAVRSSADGGARWLTPAVLERERLRSLRMVHRVLELERQRAPFRVEYCERDLQWGAHGAALRLRIDRMDRLEDGTRLLLDYKTGAPRTIRLHEGDLEPLQLALYVAALAAAGESVDAATLLTLRPAELGFSGISAGTQLPQARLKPVENWPAVQEQWQLALADLLQAHLSGAATLATDVSACRSCHLPALCRRAGADEQEPDDE